MAAAMVAQMGTMTGRLSGVWLAGMTEQTTAELLDARKAAQLAEQWVDWSAGSKVFGKAAKMAQRWVGLSAALKDRP